LHFSKGLYGRSLPSKDADGREFVFCLYDADNQRILLLAAKSEEEKEEWMEFINSVSRIREL
jgi:hypothetical protein